MPQLASADRGNTTFFAADDLRDADTQPNFGGTSASAPHAAAIAALVLQKAGGPKSYSPTALRKRLQDSTFNHDLDPMTRAAAPQRPDRHRQGQRRARRTSGTHAGLDGGPEVLHRDATPASEAVKSVTFYGETASPTALGKRNPPLSDGIVFDPRPFTGRARSATTGFPFTIGATSGGLAEERSRRPSRCRVAASRSPASTAG